MKILFNKKLIVVLASIALILPSMVQAERISVSVKSAVVRSGPDASYEIAWEKLDKNYPLFVLEKKDAWYYVRDYENDVGWIHKSYIKKTDSVISKKDTCYVRSGPGRNNDVVFVVNNGVPFKVLKRKGKWMKIEHSDGDRGWIHEMLVW